MGPSPRLISGHLLTLLAQSVIGYFGDIQGVHPLQIELHPQGLVIDLHYDCRPAMSQNPLAYREVVRTPDLQTSYLSSVVAPNHPEDAYKTARQLEEDGLVTRKVYTQVPPKVECSLTDLGKFLMPILNQLC